MFALDTNLFIYVLQGHAEFGHRAALVLEQSQNNGSASELVYLELLSAPAFKYPKLKREALQFLDNQRLKFVPLDKSILLKAADLSAKHSPKLGAVSAIHIASALHAGADTFITNDRHLVKLKFPGLKIVTL